MTIPALILNPPTWPCKPPFAQAPVAQCCCPGKLVVSPPLPARSNRLNTLLLDGVVGVFSHSPRPMAVMHGPDGERGSRRSLFVWGEITAEGPARRMVGEFHAPDARRSGTMLGSTGPASALLHLARTHQRGDVADKLGRVAGPARRQC